MGDNGEAKETVNVDDLVIAIRRGESGYEMLVYPNISKKQRAWLHIHDPELEAKWDKAYGGRIKKKKRKKK